VFSRKPEAFRVNPSCFFQWEAYIPFFGSFSRKFQGKIFFSRILASKEKIETNFEVKSKVYGIKGLTF